MDYSEWPRLACLFFFVCLFFNSRCGEKNVLCIRGVKPHSVYACVAISSLNGSTQGRGVRC